MDSVLDSVAALEDTDIGVDDISMDEQYLDDDPTGGDPLGNISVEEDTANPLAQDPLREDTESPLVLPELSYEFGDADFGNSAQEQLDESTGGGPSKKAKNKPKGGRSNPSKALFSCTLAVYKRDFKGQTSGAYVAHWEVSANSREQFVAQVWGLSSAYLNREIVFETSPEGESTPQWSSKDKPTEEDFKHFALFVSGRRPYTVDQILDKKQHLLQSWRGKEVSLFLHVYSLSVCNRSLWMKVKEALIEPTEHDRAGAATTKALQELIEKLRKEHGEFLKGHDMAWNFWANAIHSAPAHKRSALMQQPPESLQGLFSIQEGVRMNAVRRELEMASNVSESYHEDIVGLRRAYEALKVTIDRGMQDLAYRIERLEAREQTSSSLINSMKTSVVVQENGVGASLKQQVSDAFDDQHAP